MLKSLENLTSEEKINLKNDFLNTEMTIIEICKKYQIKLQEFFKFQKEENLQKEYELPKKRIKRNSKKKKKPYQTKSKEEIRQIVSTVIKKQQTCIKPTLK